MELKVLIRKKLLKAPASSKSFLYIAQQRSDNAFYKIHTHGSYPVNPLSVAFLFQSAVDRHIAVRKFSCTMSFIEHNHYLHQWAK